jgi:hypothetical protein
MIFTPRKLSKPTTNTPHKIHKRNLNDQHGAGVQSLTFITAMASEFGPGYKFPVQ